LILNQKSVTHVVSLFCNLSSETFRVTQKPTHRAGHPAVNGNGVGGKAGVSVFPKADIYARSISPAGQLTLLSFGSNRGLTFKWDLSRALAAAEWYWTKRSYHANARKLKPLGSAGQGGF
jgi:hypothetical protein